MPFHTPTPSPCRPASADRQDGIALLVVLWVATLLTVIASSFVFSSRTDTILAQNTVGQARAEALADAAVHRALLELFKPADDPLAWKGNDVQHAWKFGEASMKVRILDISGKIDLNTAEDILLLGLFKGAGLNEAEATKLVEAILDWRDSDDLLRANGAEAPEYAAAGLKDKPTNAPFATVDELRRVLGMKPEIFEKVSPVLTVHSGQPSFNPVIAPKQALMALPGIDPTQVDSHLQARAEALAKNLPLPPFAPLAGSGAQMSGSVYSIRAEARLADETHFVREAVVRLERDALRKVIFLEWCEGTSLANAAHDNKTSAVGEKSFGSK